MTITVKTLVSRLGGTFRAARLVGVQPPRVSDWMRDDRIPARHHCRMLALALANDLPWRPPGWDERIEIKFGPPADLRARPAA